MPKLTRTNLCTFSQTKLLRFYHGLTMPHQLLKMYLPFHMYSYNPNELCLWLRNFQMQNNGEKKFRSEHFGQATTELLIDLNYEELMVALDMFKTWQHTICDILKL